MRYPSDADRLDHALGLYIADRIRAGEARFGFDLSVFGLPEVVGTAAEDIGVSRTGWPWAWALVEHVIHKLGTFLGTKHDPSAERAPGSEDWLQRARRAGPDAPIGAADAAEFRQWLLREKYERRVKRPGVTRNIHEYFQLRNKTFKQDWELGKITMDGIAVLLDARDDRSHLIPKDVLSNCGSLLNPTGGRHQMLGWGSPIQTSVEEHQDDILLLQLMSDYGMLAMWADVGGLQFWISGEDLAARRFDRVTFTLEGG